MGLFVVLTLSLGFLLGSSESIFATVKVYKNCATLNKEHPGGVALPGAVNVGGRAIYLPKYDKSLYTANKKSDRDKDGIACEK
jgi:hypothetical protein